ncbi:MAG: hypothetical protein Q4C67_11475 [Deinococcus sp.]|nr:hypothetical protein [Deinococcus sp.]
MDILRAINLITNTTLRLGAYLAGIILLLLLGTSLLSLFMLPPVPLKGGEAAAPTGLMLLLVMGAGQLGVSALLARWVYSSRLNIILKAILYVLLGYMALMAVLMPAGFLMAGQA